MDDQVVKQIMRCWFKSGCSPIWWEYSLTVKHIIYWPMFSSISVQNSSCCYQSFCVQTDQGSPTNKSCVWFLTQKKRKRLVCCVIYFTFVASGAAERFEKYYGYTGDEGWEVWGWTRNRGQKSGKASSVFTVLPTRFTLSFMTSFAPPILLLLGGVLLAECVCMLLWHCLCGSNK